MTSIDYLRRFTTASDRSSDDTERETTGVAEPMADRAETDGGDRTVALESESAATIGVDPGAATRLERACEAIGVTPAEQSDLDSSLDELEIDVTEFESTYPVSVPVDAAARHARVLSTVFDERDPERASRVASTAKTQAEAGVPPSAYVATYERVVDRLVDRAFDGLEGGDEVDEARERLRAGLNGALVDMQVGVDEFADEDVVAPLEDNEYVAHVGIEEIFESLPHAAFLIDDENTVLYYNTPHRRILSFDDDHREHIGRDCRESIAAATYTDGRRHYTLADKVAENPLDAAEEWDVERVDDEYELTEEVIYRDTSVTKDQSGRETSIEFLAIPIFDERDEPKAVLELVYDRSDEVVRQQSVAELITEVTDTLYRIGEGDLSARAEFEDDHDVVEPHLLELTTDVNEMAANFEEVVTRVDRKTTELADSIDRATGYATRIDEQAASQNESLETVADELEDFSATMEEVAASSQDVADAADAALEEVEHGVAASEDARDVTDQVMKSSNELVDTVEQLDAYMDEIGEVAEVIADVADQTNLLALNANIEAAKADDAGAGFAVVADEVKTLAAETQRHTDEIASHIEQVQDQTVETVDEVETSHEHIQRVETEIDTVLASLETISDRVQTAADGIQEVAGANDKQAASVEEVVATVEDVRESSTNVTETTDDIVEETAAQEEAVFELADRVRRLSGDEDRS